MRSHQGGVQSCRNGTMRARGKDRSPSRRLAQAPDGPEAGYLDAQSTRFSMQQLSLAPIAMDHTIRTFVLDGDAILFVPSPYLCTPCSPGVSTGNAPPMQRRWRSPTLDGAVTFPAGHSRTKNRPTVAISPVVMSVESPEPCRDPSNWSSAVLRARETLGRHGACAVEEARCQPHGTS